MFRYLNLEDLDCFFGNNLENRQKRNKVEVDRCTECKGLLTVNQPIVKVYSLGDVEPLRFHRDCLARTKQETYDLDDKKRELKSVYLSKLWKYEGKPTILRTRAPIIQILNFVSSDSSSITRHIIFPESIKEITGTERERIEEFVNAREEKLKDMNQRDKILHDEIGSFHKSIELGYEFIEDKEELRQICKKHLYKVVLLIRGGKSYYLKPREDANT